MDGRANALHAAEDSKAGFGQRQLLRHRPLRHRGEREREYGKELGREDTFARSAKAGRRVGEEMPACGRFECFTAQNGRLGTSVEAGSDTENTKRQRHRSLANSGIQTSVALRVSRESGALTQGQCSAELAASRMYEQASNGTRTARRSLRFPACVTHLAYVTSIHAHTSTHMGRPTRPQLGKHDVWRRFERRPGGSCIRTRVPSKLPDPLVYSKLWANPDVFSRARGFRMTCPCEGNTLQG